MNKKLLMFGLVGIFTVMLVTAGLVNYLSNTVTGEIDVKSPVTITVEGGESYTLDIFAGESKDVIALTEIHIDGLTGHIAENKMPGFDGEGMTIEYRVKAYPGVFEIPVCVVTNPDESKDSYFYIGDPTETLDKDSFESTTTFIAAQNLDPDASYSIETKVIMEDSVACDYEQPTFIPDTG